MKITLILLSIIVLFGCSRIIKKEGCTDPQASNYDLNSTHNNGSCEYPEEFSDPNLIGLWKGFDGADSVYYEFFGTDSVFYSVDTAGTGFNMKILKGTYELESSTAVSISLQQLDGSTDLSYYSYLFYNNYQYLGLDDGVVEELYKRQN